MAVCAGVGGLGGTGLGVGAGVPPVGAGLGFPGVETGEGAGAGLDGGEPGVVGVVGTGEAVGDGFGVGFEDWGLGLVLPHPIKAANKMAAKLPPK